MRRGWMRRAVFAASLALSALVPCLASADVAIVVHVENPESGLTSEELGRILRQEQRRFRAGGSIYLVFQSSGSPARDVVLRRVFRMNDLELKQFWLGKLYRGEIASFPRVVDSDVAVKRLVARAPGALGFVDAAALDGSVKVLHIDGKLPGEPGYLLAAQR
jgi:ABC-type phosphate transport system substrate-binding protein